MPTNTDKIDLLLQYALLVAGDEDDFVDRQLGPIHLIKYVYLSDLFYARRNEGRTFTGTEWRFHKFGPWSQVVNERIVPALNSISADVRSFPSDYDDKNDWFRWSANDEYLLSEKEEQLPVEIRINLKRDIHKYGKNTPDLLDYVYRTKPMLSAAPGEILDFGTAVEKRLEDVEPLALRSTGLSEKKKKSFSERMQRLRTKRNEGGFKKRKLVNPVKEPRYDEVFEKGMAWLDDLAGSKLTSREIRVEFSDGVWKSDTRQGDDIS